MSKGSTEYILEPDARENERRDRLVTFILETLKGLQYGELTLIVQDGVVVQVNRIEKRRVPRAAH